MEECGMDTVFRVLTDNATREIYLLEQWGQVDEDLVFEWVDELKT